jgi:hypothetical protein
MARGVTVDISNALIITALNVPGQPVHNWSERVERRIRTRATSSSPVNNPLNAEHRGGVVGTYKASWRGDRIGTNGHKVRCTVINVSDHAAVVEYGRSGSKKYQRFSWTRWGGDIRVAETRGRGGQHILRDATNAVMPGMTNGRYTPLV